MNNVDYDDVVLSCTICSGEFNPGTEGGRCGYIGILPVNFCPTCHAGIMDFAEQEMQREEPVGDVAIDALCIWEEAIELCHRGDTSVYDWLCAPEGAYQARQHCIDLAPLLAVAWQQVQNHFDITFDWEFVPEALPLFARKPFDEANTVEHADWVAKTIIKRHRFNIDTVLDEDRQRTLDLRF